MEVGLRRVSVASRISESLWGDISLSATDLRHRICSIIKADCKSKVHEAYRFSVQRIKEDVFGFDITMRKIWEDEPECLT